MTMASYAPLFAHVDAWQWTPNLIWFDNLRSYGTPELLRPEAVRDEHRQTHRPCLRERFAVERGRRRVHECRHGRPIG